MVAEALGQKSRKDLVGLKLERLTEMGVPRAERRVRTKSMQWWNKNTLCCAVVTQLVVVSIEVVAIVVSGKYGFEVHAVDRRILLDVTEFPELSVAIKPREFLCHRIIWVNLTVMRLGSEPSRR